MPGKEELARFEADLKAARKLPPEINKLIEITKNAHPMDVLRTAVSALAAFDPDVADNSPQAIVRKGVRLASQVPMIVAAHEHIRNGRAPVAPDPALGHAANFLYMLKGAAPSADTARLMDTDMILHAEHGSNASSFTARVVAGTEANLHAAITAAIAALSGPAHGGAAENVMNMAQEIGEAANAAEYVKRKRANKEPVMGLGTASTALRIRARAICARASRNSRARWASRSGTRSWALVAAMERYARHGVNVNVDFYAGVVYYLNGIPRRPLRADLRHRPRASWTVQVLEQMENNILIRPLTLYNGPQPRDYLP